MAVNTFKGYSAQVTYGEESTYGTLATSLTSTFGRTTNFAPAPSNEFYKGRGVGEGRNLQDATVGKFNLTGTISFEVVDGEILKFAFGADDSPANPRAVSESDSLPSMSIQAAHVADDGTKIIDEYTGCVCQTLELNATQGAKLLGTFTWLGLNVDSSETTEATAVFPTDNPFVFEQGIIKRAGTPIARVESFIVTLNNNVDPDFAIGSRFIQEPQAGVRDYTFTLTCKLLDKVFMDDFYGATDTPMTGITSSSPTPVDLIMDFTQDANRYLRVTLTDCYFESLGKNIDSPEGYIIQNLSGFATSGSATFKK